MCNTSRGLLGMHHKWTTSSGVLKTMPNFLLKKSTLMANCQKNILNNKKKYSKRFHIKI